MYRKSHKGNIRADLKVKKIEEPQEKLGSIAFCIYAIRSTINKCINFKVQNSLPCMVWFGGAWTN
jgi:hypothetical protein